MCCMSMETCYTAPEMRFKLMKQISPPLNAFQACLSFHTIMCLVKGGKGHVSFNIALQELTFETERHKS